MKKRMKKLLAIGVISISLICNNLVVFAEEGAPDVIAGEEIAESEVVEEVSESEVIEETEETIEENESIEETETALTIEENEDGSKTISYEETIEGIESETEADEIVEEKTSEQEEIKADIESQNGTYDYTVQVETITIVTEHEDEVDTAEAATALASEVNGEIVETETEVEYETETIVNDETEVDKFIDGLLEENPNREINEVTTEVESGVTAELVDEKGYHIEENEDGTFTIVITGGLDEINIDLAWFSGDQIVFPGDKISAGFTIVNESGDKYKVESYEKSTEGPFRYQTANKFTEDLGEVVETIISGGREYVIYIPNEILKVNGKDIDRSTLEITYNKWKDKTMRERRQLAKELTDEDLKDFYNEQLGTDYETAYEAWSANLNDRLWTTTYTKDGEEAAYGEEFWTSVDLTTDTPVDFTMTAKLDGLGTDNVYQMTTWGFVENILLSVLNNIKVSVTYTDTETNYSVKYTTSEDTYNVIVTGEGEIPAEVIEETEETIETEIIEETEEIVETEESIVIIEDEEVAKSETVEEKEEVKEERTETENVVLGETREKEQKVEEVKDDNTVLGASRGVSPKTADTSKNPVGCIILILVCLVGAVVMIALDHKDNNDNKK